MNDRTTKTLLALIALALWGMILRPTVVPTPAQAQGKTKAQAQVKTKQVKYTFLSVNNSYKGGWTDVQKELDASVKQGWRVNSIAAQDEYLVILLEK